MAMGKTKGKKEIKKGEQTSHRYNCLPLLPSGPGGVQQELVVLIRRTAKIQQIFNSTATILK